MKHSTHKAHVADRRRGGFTLVELMLAIVIMALLMMISLPSISRAIQTRQANRSVQIIRTDFLLAQSLAARQRSPVRVTLDAAKRQYFFTKLTNGDTLHTRSFGADADLGLQELAFTPALIDFLPSGITSNALTVSVVAGQSSYSITVTRAGQVRVH